MSWLPTSALRDDMQNPVIAPTLRPRRFQDALRQCFHYRLLLAPRGSRPPWAFTSVAMWDCPFVVRCHWGWEVRELCGEAGFDTYICVLGMAWRVDRVWQWYT